ncbi:hypothetical protein LAUMK136_04611 [Mycobacterium attenuatum]|uniref:Uncharacterized protein n=1 Tax=Mycobacterium attenuatum TaxID=2341086 RepID=A0A498QD98_9MYCO|nr:hypothetical protein LAUMK136_04611 [Mycobacterium attenuatum]
MPDKAGLAARANGREATGPVIPAAPAGTRSYSATVAPEETGPGAPRAATAERVDCCMETEAVAD